MLLSKNAQEKLKSASLQSRLPLDQLTKKLQSIDVNSLKGDPAIRRVTGVDEEIYVMRIKHFRLFLTRKGGDVVLLSIEND